MMMCDLLLTALTVLCSGICMLHMYAMLLVFNWFIADTAYAHSRRQTLVSASVPHNYHSPG